MTAVDAFKFFAKTIFQIAFDEVEATKMKAIFATDSQDWKENGKRWVKMDPKTDEDLVTEPKHQFQKRY